MKIMHILTINYTINYESTSMESVTRIEVLKHFTHTKSLSPI